MINFEKQTWYNKNDQNNQDKRIPISAFHLNRIEEAISETVSHKNDMKSHWWGVSKITGNEVCVTDDSGCYSYFYPWTTTDQTSTIYYSDSVKLVVDNNTGETYMELENPTTQVISYNAFEESGMIMFAYKYFMFDKVDTRDGGILYYHNYQYVRRVSTYSDGFTKYGVDFYSLYKPAIKDVYEKIGYVHSPNRDGYNDGLNENDGLIYEYLGIPFENSVESCGMITGWYYGDRSEQRLINTLRKPKRVIIDDIHYATDYGEGSIRLADNGFYVGTGSSFSYNGIGKKYQYVVFY